MALLPDEPDGPLRNPAAAFWGLPTPVMIPGGVRSDAFTPTEATTVHALDAGGLAHRPPTWRGLRVAPGDAAASSAVAMRAVACASLLGRVAAADALVGRASEGLRGSAKARP